MAGVEIVRKQIVDAFVGVHGDHRTREQLQADEEMRAAIQDDAAIQREADDVSEFIGWIEETEAEIELIDLDSGADVDVTVQECLLRLEQNPYSSESYGVYYVEPPLESAQTLIEHALRQLGE